MSRKRLEMPRALPKLQIRVSAVFFSLGLVVFNQGEFTLNHIPYERCWRILVVLTWKYRESGRPHVDRRWCAECSSQRAANRV
jgi:hypothetical protein